MQPKADTDGQRSTLHTPTCELSTCYAANFQVKHQLENLDAIRVVSVVKDSTLTNGAVTWTVTFDTEIGDLPMLEVTSGRLTGTESQDVAIANASVSCG